MADTFTFELVSPERLLISQPAQSVLVPGAEGDFQVLANHAPVLATLRPGLLDVVLENGEERRLFVRGGFAEARPDGLTVLAQQAIDSAELDREELAQQIRNAEEDVADAKDDAARDKAREVLDSLRQIQQSLGLT
ncbi:MAG: F0F1 ATP synthase subunit epsilon [Alphaproteobacteria bacterium]|nr:MAG: F0F1 ATP synthase subunit epsilon [Alphaproteobacteria bacterium]